MKDEDKKIIKENKNASKVDWIAVEHDYCVGILTVRQIAEKHSTSTAALAQKVKKHKWERNLSHKINTRADGIVAQGLLAKNTVCVGVGIAMRKEGLLEASAQAQAQIKQSHRVIIEKLREITDRMISAFDSENFRELNGLERSRAVADINTLSQAVKCQIGVERVAWNMDGNQQLAATGLSQESSELLRAMKERIENQQCSITASETTRTIRFDDFSN